MGQPDFLFDLIARQHFWYLNQNKKLKRGVAEEKGRERK